MRVEKFRKERKHVDLLYQTNQSSPNIGPNLGSCHVGSESKVLLVHGLRETRA